MLQRVIINTVCGEIMLQRVIINTVCGEIMLQRVIIKYSLWWNNVATNNYKIEFVVK